MKPSPFFKTKKLVRSIDCTAAAGADYFESHPTEIVRSPAGTYRQCAGVQFSRFAYRYQIEDVQRPHLLRIRYPDDAERTFCIMDGVSYDISTGIATGRECAVSGEMKWHDILFWPRQKENFVMLISWDGAAVAAAAQIEIYRLDDDALRHDPLPAAGRQIGMQWEDPCGRYLSLGAHKRTDWPNRLADYCAAVGQNIVEYPISWYWGCLYPSAIDACDHLEQVVDSKGSIFMNGISHCADWVAETIEILGRKNIAFVGVFHTYRFHHLLKHALQDPSLLNVSQDGKPQRSPLDWTRTWTRMNLPHMASAEGVDDPESVAGTAYECTSGMHQIPDNLLGEPMGKVDGFCGPVFNCLHPAVQNHLLALMRELHQRYAHYENFKGISLPLWAASSIWFGSMKLGYDDLSFSLFEREMALTSGIDSQDPNRFHKRHRWIADHHAQAFQTWRCAKVYDLLCRMQQALAGGRKDIRLTVSICREPLLGQLFCGDLPELYHDSCIQLYKLGGLDALLRAGGMDPALFTTPGGPELEIQFDPFRDRSLDGKLGKSLNSNTLRDHDYLDHAILKHISHPHNRNAFIFNCYYESGRYVIGQPLKEIPADLADAGTGIENLYHLYLVFKHKTWTWREHEFTTCPGVPTAGRHFLEYFAHALGTLDAKQITFGGLTVGTWGHERELAEFSRTFAQLPQDPFHLVPANADSVVCRYLQKDGRTTFYLMNMEPEAITATVVLNHSGARIHSLSQQTDVQLTHDTHTVHLRAFELAAFSADESVRPVELEIAWTAAMQERMQQAKALRCRLQESGMASKPWGQWLDAELQRYLQNHQCALLRQALQSGPAKRANNATPAIIQTATIPPQVMQRQNVAVLPRD